LCSGSDSSEIKIKIILLHELCLYSRVFNLDAIPSKMFIITVCNKSTCGMSIVNSTKALKVFVEDCSSSFTDTGRKDEQL